MTVTLDEQLYRRTRAAAVATGQTIDEFVAGALERAVNGATALMEIRDGLPVMIPGAGAPLIDPACVRRAIEEE